MTITSASCRIENPAGKRREIARRWAELDALKNRGL